MSLSTHVLDSTTGLPAAEVGVELRTSDGLTLLQSAVTNTDGRITDFGDVAAGVYQLVFDTGAYFDRRGAATFYPEVVVTFQIANGDAHHHVPLLLSPFAYSTYRGS